jgi:hypothetical protein
MYQLEIMMASTFSKYATSANFYAFSASDLCAMTFERAAELAYPKVASAAPNSMISITSWCYSTNIPTSAAGYHF